MQLLTPATAGDTAWQAAGTGTFLTQEGQGWDAAHVDTEEQHTPARQAAQASDGSESPDSQMG